MNTARDIRRFAFQAVFQLDARGEITPEELLAALRADAEASVNDKTLTKAVERALAAYHARAASDAAMLELAPTWPAHRQAAADRAILRLAHWEMCSGTTTPKVVVNEAVELAKEFGTDKSPAFVNALLDKVLKKLEASGAVKTAPGAAAASPDSELS